MTSIAEQVLHILEQIAETDDVRDDPDLPLFELNILDSLSTVSLLIAIDRELGLRIAPTDVERAHWATPRKLVADVERRLATRRA